MCTFHFTQTLNFVVVFTKLRIAEDAEECEMLEKHTGVNRSFRSAQINFMMGTKLGRYSKTWTY